MTKHISICMAATTFRMTEYGPGLVPTNWYNSRYMMIKLRSGARFRQKRCIRCYFFEENVNGVNYLDMLKHFFWPKHRQLDNVQKYYFHQDGATSKKRGQNMVKGQIWQEVIGCQHLATMESRFKPM